MSTAPNARDAEPQTELTDSPWFWVCVFSAVAVGGTVAIAPKYEKVQARLELREEARQRSFEYANRVDAADGDTAKVIAETAGEGQAAFQSLDDDRRTLLIRLTPLLALLSTIFVVSLIRVCWIQSQFDRAPLVDARRGIVFVLTIVFCGVMLYTIWSSHSMGGLASATKTVILLLIASILIALAASSLWRNNSAA